jgi:hypothetical protein
MIALILAGCAASAPPLRSASSRPHPSIVATDFHDRALAPSDTSVVLANSAAIVDKLDEKDAMGSPDLYGNEVIDAVAKYKLDDTGSLYEVHSPQTELPRLASPVS